MNTKSFRYFAAFMGGIAATWTMTGNAQAKTGQMYVAFSLGAGSTYTKKDSDGTKYDYKNPLEGSVALGYGVTKNVRGEAEIRYESSALDSVTFESARSTNNGGVKNTQLSLMANGYYDFKTGVKIVPYLGAGLGVSRFHVKSGTVNLSSGPSNTFRFDRFTEYGPAVQLMAGVAYRVSQNTALSVGYRYFDFIKKGFSHSIRDNSALEIGLRYGF